MLKITLPLAVRPFKFDLHNNDASGKMRDSGALQLGPYGTALTKL